MDTTEQLSLHLLQLEKSLSSKEDLDLAQPKKKKKKIIWKSTKSRRFNGRPPGWSRVGSLELFGLLLLGASCEDPLQDPKGPGEPNDKPLAKVAFEIP